jgi:uncharacterized membrane protein
VLETLQQIVYFFGHGLCHQYPSRSFAAGGIYFGLCARDTGIFLGLLFTVIVICLFYAGHRVKPSGLPVAWVTACCGLLIVPMALDGISSYAGLRSTTNLIRYITGYLCGTGLGILAASAVFSFWRQNDPTASPVSKPAMLAAVLGAAVLPGVLFYLFYPLLGLAAPLLLLVAQWTVFAGLALMVIRSTGLLVRLAGQVLLAVPIGLATIALLSLLAQLLRLLFPWYVHP